MKNTQKTILGAIAGDIIGSAYEFNNTKDFDFELFPPGSTFTDDSVLTIAIADCILHEKDFQKTVWEYARKYPKRGYGGMFSRWMRSKKPQPYNSYGNGSAMRVSPVGFAFDNTDQVLEKARQSAEITHNHPEGIKGAQAVAAAVFLAKNGKNKTEIENFIRQTFHYNLNFSIEEIRPYYDFDVTCQGSVPQAIKAFLESTDYENAIRLAVSLGGDSDTIACITGAIATAFYKKIPQEIVQNAENELPPEFLEIIDQFDKRFA